MEKKGFKVGDRVENDDTEYAGIVTAVDDLGCDVRFDDGEEVWILKDLLRHSDEPKYDPKTAFLAELKDLLDKYNASIYVDYDQSDEIYTTTIAVGEDSVKYSYTYGIDTDNVLNYDK